MPKKKIKEDKPIKDSGKSPTNAIVSPQEPPPQPPLPPRV